MPTCSLQILQEAGLSDLKKDLIDFVATDILTTASQLQSRSGVISIPSEQIFQVVDDFALEYIECIAGLSTEEVKGVTLYSIM